MRVLHVIESMNRGGAESLVLEHLRHAGPGVESMVCALNRGGPSLEIAAQLGAQTLMLGKGGQRARGYQQLTTTMHEWRADVVNGHNPVGALYATPAARWARVPVVFRFEHSIHYPGRHSRIYPPIEALLTAWTNRVLCVCEAAKESHATRLEWARRRFVTMLPGISSAPHTRPREELRRELGVEAGERVVLSVGSLTQQKAQYVLIDAFARMASRVPEARLLIGGDGPLRAQLEAQIASLGIGGRARLLGPFPGDVADMIEACDLFVLSSVREGLPISVLEAMRGGRAVVTTRVGGTAEVVDDGVTGLVVPMSDPAAMAEALTMALSDPMRLAAWGEAGRQRWHDHFTAERMVRDTEALYESELRSVRKG